MYLFCEYYIGKGYVFSFGLWMKSEKVLNKNNDTFGKRHRQNSRHIALLVKGWLECEFFKDRLKLRHKGGEALQKKVL